MIHVCRVSLIIGDEESVAPAKFRQGDTHAKGPGSSKATRKPVAFSFDERLAREAHRLRSEAEALRFVVITGGKHQLSPNQEVGLARKANDRFPTQSLAAALA